LSSSTVSRRLPGSARAALLACAGLGLGCGADFDPGSELAGLRVLAVKKSSPYATPGSQVELELLWHDSEPERPPPQIAWLAACENPAGDLFEGCFQAAAQLTPEGAPATALDLITRGRLSLPDPSSERANDRFSFATSPDIISARPPPKDPTTVPYGLDYVFFAACAGTLGLVDDRAFPFICYVEQDDEPGLSAGDTELGSSDFIVGYSAVFSYEALANQNPLISGVEWQDLQLFPGEPPLSADGTPLDTPVLGPDDLCIGEACPPVPTEQDPGVCPEALSLPACPGDCDEVRFGPVVDPASAETDESASNLRSIQVQEQMWVNFYVSDGEVSQEVRLLNDASVGWNADHATKFKPGKEPAVTYAWSVAHDNRGGAEWARLRVCVR
jgi:hypothetical protein